MKAVVGHRYIASALALAAAACVASGDQTLGVEVPPVPPVPPAESPVPPSDAGAPPSEGGDAGKRPLCSADGWCMTALPGNDISAVDIWPFENRAFAMIEGEYIGSKIAEWTPDHGWELILKKVTFPDYSFSGSVWARNEDEVYFTIRDMRGLFGDFGIQPEWLGFYGPFVARGRRPVPPATEWSWTTSKIDCDRAEDSTPLWGANDSSVYVTTCGKVYRLDHAGDAGADGGADTLHWIEEPFVDVDPSHPIQFYGISGTGPDDIWFGGGRWFGTPPPFGAGGERGCVVLIHKTSAGYSTVIDGIPSAEGCSARGDLPAVDGVLASSIHTPAPGHMIGAARMAQSGPNTDSYVLSVTVNQAQVSITTSKPDDTNFLLHSPWGISTDEFFVIGSGSILRARSIFGGAPSYEYEKLSINGVPNGSQLFKVRGTSNHNLWAVGSGNAYHKTTP